MTYPGYEIERFENEGGSCCSEKCTICLPIIEEARNAEKQERHEKHQESGSVRETKGNRIHEI